MPTVLLFIFILLLSSTSIYLSYFNLAVLMCKCFGEHSWTCYIFFISMLNGTWSLCSAKMAMRSVNNALSNLLFPCTSVGDNPNEWVPYFLYYIAILNGTQLFVLCNDYEQFWKQSFVNLNAKLNFYISCLLNFFSYSLFFACLLFFSFFDKFNSCYFHVQVLGETLFAVFLIFICSHTECNILSSWDEIT